MPKPVSIGAKRHTITIERRTSGTDAMGDSATTWPSVGSAFAEVATGSGREFLLAQQTRPELLARFKVRAGELVITPEDRVRFNGRVMNILAAFDSDDRGRELWIDCSEWPGGEDG